jgi:hypothetical protein
MFDNDCLALVAHRTFLALCTTSFNIQISAFYPDIIFMKLYQCPNWGRGAQGSGGET